jgi:hypothetical protein
MRSSNEIEALFAAEAPMQDEKKTEPLAASDQPAKPLVTQIIEAVIDGAADFAKSVAVGTAVRVGQSAKKTEVGKAAIAIVKKAEGNPSTKKPKKAAAKRSRVKKASPKKSKTAATKSIANKGKAKAKMRVAKSKVAAKKRRSR